MALDGAFLSCLCRELAVELADARIDKIHQPSREELIISLHRRGGNCKLYFSIRAASPRLHLLSSVPDNPDVPPMFCMLLRKRLSGGRFAGIRQNGLERAVYLDWDCTNELGDRVRLTLAAELMGRHSNLILIENGTVVDTLRRVTPDMSSVRPVLPGLPYAAPPSQAGKTDLSLGSPEQLVADVLNDHGRLLSEALLGRSMGISPLLCREAAFRATGSTDARVGEFDADTTAQKLIAFLGRIRETAVGDTAQAIPYLITDSDGIPMEFSFLPITQYGLSVTGQPVSSLSALLEQFYTRREETERLKQRSRDLRQMLTATRDRIARKVEHQRAELTQSADREQHRIYGDLLNAQLYAVPKGAATVELVNYYDPEAQTVSIPLDPALSAAQNAAKYYKAYRKAQTAEKVLVGQIAAGEAELEYLETVFDALSRASSFREIGELRTELENAGYLRHRGDKQKPPPPLGPLKFRSTDGFTILVGRNNLQNDRLTLKIAHKDDIWLHTKLIAGSHVIVVTDGQTPPESTLAQAAVLAATHSKGAQSSQVPVDMTKVRYVRKPAEAKPGKVIYDHHQTLYVTPDERLAEQLAKLAQDEP